MQNDQCFHGGTHKRSASTQYITLFAHSTDTLPLLGLCMDQAMMGSPTAPPRTINQHMYYSSFKNSAG